MSTTMAASPKEKFDAAVAVIETLPKNGNFVPSHSMLLQFYGYYKQATQGPCGIPRPGFWDVIGKAKWDAWNKLGQMDREQAMLAYVDELKQIVEAMPHTETVQNFVQKLGNFYELVDPPPSVKGQGDGSGDSGQGSLPGTPQRSSGANSEDDASHDLDASTSKDTSEDFDQELDRDEVLIQSIKRDQRDGALKPEPENMDIPIEMHSLQVNGTGSLTAVTNGSNVMATDPNTMVMNGGTNGLGHEGEDSSSESEGEEFCDTSDAPLMQEKLSATTGGITRPPQTRISSGPSSGNLGPRSSSSSHMLMDPGQMMDRTWSSGNFSMSPSQSASDMLTMRGGGETTTGNPPGISNEGNPQGFPSQGRGAVPRRNQQGSSRSHLMSAGGGSGGRGNEGPPGNPYQQPPDINEQITMALLRLQQDMNSVLTRLNALEGQTVTQHDRHAQSRGNSRASGGATAAWWWWPFSGVRGRTVFFMLVWPFIVHWIITFLARRRHRRR